MPVLLAAAGDEADRLTREGLELRRAGKDEKALELFRQAEIRESSPRLRAQIGLAEQALGRWVAADRDLASALRFRDDPWISKNRLTLERAAQLVADHLGTVTILGSPAGASVLINGQRAGTLPMAEPYVVAAGDAVITVEAPGHASLRRTITVAGRGVVRETIELPPDGSPSASAGGGASAPDRHSSANLGAGRAEPPVAVSGLGATPGDRGAVPSERASSAWPWQRSTGVALLAVAAASLVFGIVETVNRESKANGFKQAGCGTNDLSIGDCRDRYNQVQSARTWMIVGYVAAATAGVAGTWFLVLSPAGSAATGDDGTGATSVSGISINLRGRF
jgi:hypothetical protein